MIVFPSQVILSPVDSVADTYRALLPEGTTMEFQRVLELKVVDRILSLRHILIEYEKRKMILFL